MREKGRECYVRRILITLSVFRSFDFSKSLHHVRFKIPIAYYATSILIEIIYKRANLLCDAICLPICQASEDTTIIVAEKRNQTPREDIDYTLFTDRECRNAVLGPPIHPWNRISVSGCFIVVGTMVVERTDADVEAAIVSRSSLDRFFMSQSSITGTFSSFHLVS